MKRKVLITRSQPGADILAATLLEAGYLPRISSVIQIEAISAFNATSGFEKYSAFIFVSASAARMATEITASLKKIEKPAIYAIGPETERQLALAGLQSSCPERADSEGLLALADLQAVNAKRILIICGRGGRETLQQNLQDRGAVVTRAEVYRRIPTHVILQNTDDLDAVIISSGEGLRLFLDLLTELPTRVPLLLPSQRVAEQARAASVKHIIVCEGASSEAVLNKLETLFLCA